MSTLIWHGNLLMSTLILSWNMLIVPASELVNTLFFPGNMLMSTNNLAWEHAHEVKFLKKSRPDLWSGRETKCRPQIGP